MADPARPTVPAQAPAGGSSLMAKLALVLALLSCGITNLVSTVLAVIVLRRRLPGRGLAIAALVYNAVFAGVLIVGAILLTSVVNTPRLDDLETGDCLNSDRLTKRHWVTPFDRVECAKPHDGEVLATMTLTGAEAESFEAASATKKHCTPKVNSGAWTKRPRGVVLQAFAEKSVPEAGDTLVCIAFYGDGRQLSGDLP